MALVAYCLACLVLHILLFFLPIFQMAACPDPHGLCIVTELCSISLFDFLHNETETPISWRMRMQIATDTARGMSYLHANKGGAILHRDLKRSA